ncbi:MAG: isochorismate synthase [Actinomycetota bacterium]
MSPVGLDRATRLAAHTELLADPGDLLDHLGRDGCAWLDRGEGFVTAGCAARVAPEHAAALLAAIRHDRTGAAPRTVGPRAVGALPFAGGGVLIVPATLVVRDHEGRTWRTVIEGATASSDVRVAQPAPRIVRIGRGDRRAWTAMVRAALHDIRTGEYEKVVLSRAVDVEADEPFDVRVTLAALRRDQPGCIVFADGTFVGASPELLVRRRGRNLECRPMAGTGDDAARLLASTKDAREHQIVVNAMLDTLRTHGCDVDATGPTAERFATVTHLATTIRGQRHTHLTAVDLARILHPTPAVGGWPTDAALAAIARLERHDRGQYAGPCGWVDANGDGEFVIALRCAALDERSARCYAGAGIVAGSQPEAEWHETQTKLQPMLRALTI